MAYKIVWSKEATTSFDSVVQYLTKNFTEKEVTNFLLEINRKLALISLMP
jgi:hypothetical protein